MFSFSTKVKPKYSLHRNSIILLLSVVITYVCNEGKNDNIFLYWFSVPPKLTPLPVLSDPLFIDDFYQLYCSVLQGDPPFRIQWLFRNQPLTDRPNIKIDSTKRSSTLVFDAISGDNMGEYICVASNKAGFANSSTEIIVKGFKSN